MYTKEEISAGIKTQFTNVKERGRVLARALKARAAIAATRRRLRAAFAELGEHIYERTEAGQAWGRGEDTDLASFQVRIRGLKTELSQREEALRAILEGRVEKPEEKEVEEVAAPEKKGKEAKSDKKTATRSVEG